MQFTIAFAKLQTSFRSPQSFHQCPFFVPGSNSGPLVVFSFTSPWPPSPWTTSQSFPSSFTTLTLSKSPGQLFCKLLLHLGVSNVFSWLYWDHTFLARRTKGRYAPLRVSCEGHVMPEELRLVIVTLITKPRGIHSSLCDWDMSWEKPCRHPVSSRILTH